MRRLIPFAVALVLAGPAQAVQPDEVLKDSVLEHRARDISSGLRCLVCQNQSIDDSEAPLARDLRLLVRERLVAGDTDDQVRDFLVKRYGEFVLLKPAFEMKTLILWLAPFLIFVMGGASLFITLRRRPKPVAKPLDEAETSALELLLKEEV